MPSAAVDKSCHHSKCRLAGCVALAAAARRAGQVTDRFIKAIGQLGSDKLDVRIGGIYALERVAHDSFTDHPTVMEVLAAFIREHSQAQWSPHGPDGGSTRPDVQAALSFIGRRNPIHWPQPD
jgi:hypothetical protein